MMIIIIKPGDGARRVGGRGMWTPHTTGIALIIVFKPPNILSEEMIILTQARKGKEERERIRNEESQVKIYISVRVHSQNSHLQN